MIDTLNTPHNPILNGLYADPHILFHEDCFYIYPTTDGKCWQSTSFDCFSSNDLVHWKCTPNIFDVGAGVPWAKGLAWAPAAIYYNGFFYFYYCADQKIGVAYSKSPMGPFINCSTICPLLEMNMLPQNIRLNQTIDPFAFVDDDGIPYLYFGNGEKSAVVELEKDMITLKIETMKNIDWIGCADFCEAISVFKRNGIYYFSWSCDDTRSENYHVNYGTSASPTGPIEVKGTLLSKDVQKKILATGHHCIIKLPSTGTYYIVYHRFAEPAPAGISGWDRGYHREICMDKLTFDKPGFIHTVIPTF